MKLSLVAVLLLCLAQGECRFKLNLRGFENGGKGPASGEGDAGGKSEEPTFGDDNSGEITAPPCPSPEQFKSKMLEVVESIKNFEQKIADVRDAAARFLDGEDETTFQDVVNEYMALTWHSAQTFGAFDFIGHYIDCIISGANGFGRKENCDQMIAFANTSQTLDTSDVTEYQKEMAESFIEDLECFKTEYSLLETLAEDELQESEGISKRRALSLMMEFAIELMDYEENGSRFYDAVSRAYNKTQPMQSQESEDVSESDEEERSLRQLLDVLLSRTNRARSKLTKP